MDRDGYEVQIALTDADRRILAGVAGLPLVGRYTAGETVLRLVLDPGGYDDFEWGDTPDFDERAPEAP